MARNKRKNRIANTLAVCFWLCAWQAASVCIGQKLILVSPLEVCGALLALLQKQGVRNVYGIVTLPNPASEALHRHFGFRTVGAYTRSGYKNGRWLDVGIFEKQIGSFDGEPEPLQPIGAIADREEILRVYNQH